MTGEMIKNVEQVAALIYATENPTKSQRNQVAKLCREGKLEAVKAGRRWLVRIDWPGHEG